jgi:hypothetical protein
MQTTVPETLGTFHQIGLSDRGTNPRITLLEGIDIVPLDLDIAIHVERIPIDLSTRMTGLRLSLMGTHHPAQLEVQSLLLLRMKSVPLLATLVTVHVPQLPRDRAVFHQLSHPLPSLELADRNVTSMEADQFPTLNARRLVVLLGFMTVTDHPRVRK